MSEYIVNINSNIEMYLKNNKSNCVLFLIENPISDIEYPTDNNTTLSEINSIINKINYLKLSYPTIKINVGIISEYKFDKEKFLGSLRSSVDTILLRINKTNPKEYLSGMINGLETGIFDGVYGIEELFKYRETLKESKRKEFDNNSSVLESIIKKLKEEDIPLIVNANNIPYGMVSLFRIISYYKNKVIKVNGDINNREVNMLNINYIDYTNPLMERLKKERLNYIFNRRQTNSNTIYTERSITLLKSVLDKTPKETDKELVLYYIENSLDNSINIDREKASYLDTGEFNKIEKISLSNYSKEEKSNYMQVIKERINIINETLSKRINLINLIKDSVKYTFQIGASSPDEIIKICTYLIEIKMTSDESVRKVLIDKLDELESKLSTGKESDARKTLHNEFSSSNNFFNWNSGLIMYSSLILLLTFIFGFGIGVAYMLIKM